MDYIMVTFKINDKNVDLKIPTFVKIQELLEMLAESLGFAISSGNRLQAEPLGRILDCRAAN